MKICLDPGHSGNWEPGACTAGVREADVNLMVARLVAKLLIRKGHKVLLTRDGEIEDDGLSWRAEMANCNQADLFISLHCNSAANSQAHGTETWYFAGSEEGEAVARIIQEQIVWRAETADRGIKPTQNITVLRKTVCPAVLVEMAFLSNSRDRYLLTDLLMRRLFAVAMVEAVEIWQKAKKLPE